MFFDSFQKSVNNFVLIENQSIVTKKTFSSPESFILV